MNKKLLGISIALVVLFFLLELFGYPVLFLLYPIILLILVNLALLPANIAKKKGYSFIGFFIFSFFLFIPALIVALCILPSTRTINVAPVIAASADTASAKSITDQIIELSELKAKGIINDNEFEIAKGKLLNN